MIVGLFGLIGLLLLGPALAAVYLVVVLQRRRPAPDAGRPDPSSEGPGRPDVRER